MSDLISIDSIRIPAGRRRVSPDAVTAMADSIRDLGLLNPITITKNDVLLAGLHRLRACEVLGWTEIPYTRVNPNLSPVYWELAEIDENLIRNDLTVLERSECYLRRKGLYEQIHPEAVKPQGGRPSKNDATVASFTEDTATKTGAAVRTVQTDIQIATNLTAEAKELLRDTPTADSTRELLAIAKLPETEQVEATEEIMQVWNDLRAEYGDTVTAARIKNLVRKRLERIAREQKSERARANAPPIQPLTIGDAEIRQGKFTEALADIEPGSVSLILTDPPYLKEYLDEWNELGKFAACVLKPGGILATYSGQFHLPRVIADLNEHLEYGWTLAMLGRGPKTLVHARRIYSAWKPVLIFYKPPFRQMDWMDDVYTGPGPEKELHDWQQSFDEAAHLIFHLSEPNDLVIDPFLGTGTSAVAAVRQGRRFIGCDIDLAAVQTARDRLNEQMGKIRDP